MKAPTWDVLRGASDSHSAGGRPKTRAQIRLRVETPAGTPAQRGSPHPVAGSLTLASSGLQPQRSLRCSLWLSVLYRNKAALVRVIEPDPVPDLAPEQMAEEGYQARLEVQVNVQAVLMVEVLRGSWQQGLRAEEDQLPISEEQAAPDEPEQVPATNVWAAMGAHQLQVSALRLHKRQLVHLSQDQPYDPVFIEVNQQEEGTPPIGRQPSS
ncbi:hypothetical protein HPB49_021660 [Dermacentor silvarum]|uniref:Uncharacterized protein n=1 Tax=Dermacentor silvarum TaxID=543639 RepID=A0ACB8CHL4_DERSI|nr:hypothetical protein HPB49_021660 [Dermacentor silvarum]